MADKIIKIISYGALIVLIALIVFLALEYYRTCDAIKLENWNLRIENQNLKEKLQECQKCNLFQQAVSQIGKRKYSEEYNCLAHTRDLQQELRKSNIESSIFISQDRDHAWLGVWVEATTGNFITPDSSLKILEVRDK